MKIPKVRLVFDRYKTASRTTKGSVQIEVLYKRKRKWMSTGIRVYENQWHPQRWIINTPGAFDMNDALRNMVSSLEKWIDDNFSHGEEFTWSSLEAYWNSEKHTDNFVDFLKKCIGERNDIRESTRRAHKKLVGILNEFGVITFFGDLTKANIIAFDNWLHGRRIRKLKSDGMEEWVPMRLQSIYSYHKLMRTYIHIAVNSGFLQADPYSGLKFQRGSSEPDRFVTKEELERIKTAPMRSGSIAKTRDLFVFQAYTGLAYSDLSAFDFKKAMLHEGDYVYSGKRVKTGEVFYFVILKPAMAILEKYKYNLPVIADQTYNRNLKKVAEDAGVNKPLATHWARRTAGMMLLNAGVRLEVVAKILGHSSVRTTEEFYASVTAKTVADEMKKAGL